jgi:hypothetical protein
LGIETDVSNILSLQENGCVQASSNAGERGPPLNYYSFAIKKEKFSVFIKVLPWDKGHLA